MLQRSRIVSIVAGLCATIAAASTAFAGDRALLDVIGYSPQGRYFAFEEYGIQDGSGFSYSNIYLVDLMEDRWVVGTPVTARAEHDTEPLWAIRKIARDKAQGRLSDLGVTRPADTLAFIGEGAVGQDGSVLEFTNATYLGSARLPVVHRLELETFETNAAAPCSDWFEMTPLGFRLTLKNADATRVVFIDDEVPRSRGCPTDYKIVGVFAPFQAQTLQYGVAIIGVYPRGFEGPDRRFIAVPLGRTN